MKKILTLFIAICMLISAIPMAVSAETINPEPSTDAITTVYVASNTTVETPDGSTPYTDLKSAYTEVTGIANGTLDRKIVILEDISAFATNDSLQSVATAHWVLEEYGQVENGDDGTVYICGTKQEDGSYPSVNFTGITNRSCVITLGANTVFYDLTFRLDTGTGSKTLWFCAASHDLTFGYNVSRYDSNTKPYVTGSCFNGTYVSTKDRDNDGQTINIYSGTFVDVFAGHRNNAAGTLTDADDIVLNIFGGYFGGQLVGGKNGGFENGFEITINIYGGTYFGSIKRNADTVGETTPPTYLYIYNGFTPKKGEANVTPSGFSNTEYAVSGTTELSLPEYAAAYVGVQNTAVGNDSKYSVRFVGVVNSLDYESVGFKISCGDKNFDTECNRAYKSIVGGENDYTAAQLGGEYIFAAAIKDIPTSAGELTFTVKPYVVVGETTYYGAAYTVTYNAGAYVSVAVAN